MAELRHGASWMVPALDLTSISWTVFRTCQSGLSLLVLQLGNLPFVCLAPRIMRAVNPLTLAVLYIPPPSSPCCRESVSLRLDERATESPGASTPALTLTDPRNGQNHRPGRLGHTGCSVTVETLDSLSSTLVLLDRSYSSL